jgi:integrase
MRDASDEAEVLPREGIHFCKRRRSKVVPRKDRILDIYRFDAVKRQTIPVGTTHTSDPEKAEVELKRFVLSDLEAQLATRKQGGKPKPKDLLLFEACSAFLLGKEAQWQKQREQDQKFARESMALMSTAHGERLAELATGTVLELVVRRTGNRKTNDRLKNFHGAIEDAKTVWPDNPFVSTLDSDEQERFVEVCRELGRADSTIKTRLSFVWTMFYWLKKKSLLLDVPEKITAEDWQPSRIGRKQKKRYTLDHLAAMLNYAGDTNDEAAWRGLNIQIPTGCRTDTAAKMIWPQADLDDARIHLNPPGRRETKKRRPTLPLVPTLDAEIRKWLASSNCHPMFIVTQAGRCADYDEAFRRVTTATGVGGTPTDIRRFTRTWLYEFEGVQEKQANIWIGHADLETSDTSRLFYIMASTDYLRTCVVAIEALYDALQPLVHYPLGHRLAAPKPDKTTWLRQIPNLRGNCVTSRFAISLNEKGITQES